MAGVVSYLGSELYVTGVDATAPTEADKIKYWRSVSGIGSFEKEPIEGEVCDGDGFSFWTTGKRSQKETVVDIHYMDKNSITKLNELALAKAEDEQCKIWFKPTALIGWDETEAFCSLAIITSKDAREANASQAQGASYVFKKSGAPITWDGTLG